MSVTGEFRTLAEEIVDDLLAADPVEATWLGDHRFDGLLPDADDAVRVTVLDDHITRLDAIDDVELDVTDLVDLEILRSRLLRDRFDAAELRTRTWNPMAWNPGTALYLLVARDVVPAGERDASLRSRLAAVPDFLASARATLGEMPAIHVETAIAQLDGTAALIASQVAPLVEDDDLVSAAASAVAEFRSWLADGLPDAQRSPRLGRERYAAALWHALDDDTDVDALLETAQAHLDEVNARMRELAARYLGSPGGDDDTVRAALGAIASRSVVTDDTVLPLMVDALDRTTGFVRRRDLVTVPDVDVRVIEMPEIHRGVAVAYCDAPGPLETADVPTFVAVAPTPADWDGARVASFYREYNGTQLHDLTVHEAMPGHVLQLAHARQLTSPTRVRRFGSSGVFVEGWAVYTEELMADEGYAPADDDSAVVAFALVQSKLLARGIINTILDIGVHAGDLDEAGAMALMTGRGFQEEGEAVGKWRRALLTSTQLPTYYVGYRAVRSIVHDLRVLHPEWSTRQVHDLVLAHGSPAPRHLRTLLGI